jgi:GT2 family glycosyltransferase
MNQITQEEQNNVLKDCSERLDKLGIPYMLTGSMALIHYAMPRNTTDIDIIIELTSNDVENFIKEFEPDYYVPHSRIKDAIYRNRMFNLISRQLSRLIALSVKMMSLIYSHFHAANK